LENCIAASTPHNHKVMTLGQCVVDEEAGAELIFI
jgi:hypothetical protein